MKRALLALTAACAVAAGANAQTGRITGIVADNSGGLPSASIGIVDSRMGAMSDRNGSFEIRGVPAGDHTLVITYMGYKTSMIPVRVPPAGGADVGRVLLVGSSIKMQEILVESSYRHGEHRARAMERQAPTIVSVLAADAIGKLPDRNAAEAIMRMPGVQMERDQGEGRYVTVRSVPSAWTAMHINGTRIPDARSGSRDMALDIFPSQFIEYIEVTKAHTPDQEADDIGGVVNFITRTPTDDRHLEVNVSSGYNNQAKSGIYDYSVKWSDSLADGDVRLVLLGSASSRDWGSDNFEVYYDDDKSIEQLQLRDYLGNRSTYGANWGMEADLSDRTMLYTSGMFTAFNDDEIRRRDRYRFNKSRYEMAFTATRYRSSLQAGTVGIKHSLSDRLSSDFSVFANRSNYGYDSPQNLPDNQQGYYYVTFRQSGVQFDGLTADGKKYLDIDSPAGYRGDHYSSIQPRLSAETPFDPDKMEFIDTRSSHYGTTGGDVALSGDLEYRLNRTMNLRFGSKYRWLKADIERAYYIWTYGKDATLSDFCLQDFPTNGGYLTEIEEVYDPLLRRWPLLESINSAHDNGAFEPQLKIQDRTNSSRATSNFDVTEKQFAGYIMPSWHITDQVQVVGGFRAEYTDASSNGYAWLDGEGRAVPNATGESYVAILPMATVTYRPNPRLDLRVAASRTYVRPNFLDIAAFESVDEQDATISRGNSALNPTFSTNLDVMVTYAIGSLSAIQGGVFYKDITDCITSGVSQEERTYPGSGTQTYRINQPFNNESAWLHGVELGYIQSLAFLPAPLNGLGFNLNYTYTDSETSLSERDGDPIPLTNQSPHTLNAQAYYEKSGLSLRVAANYRSPFIDSYNERRGLDRWRDRAFQIDLNSSVALTPGMNLYLELINLNNDPLRYYNGSEGDTDRPEQTEWYSARGSLGVHWILF